MSAIQYPGGLHEGQASLLRPELPYYRPVGLRTLVERISKEFLPLVMTLVGYSGALEEGQRFANRLGPLVSVPDDPAIRNILARVVAMARREEWRADGPPVPWTNLTPEELRPLAASFRANGFPMCAILLEDEAANPREDVAIVSDLRGEIRREIRNVVVMRLPSEKAVYFEQPQLFGPAVADGFHDAADDIEEAGNCLAMNRGTATVFHLMRVLEVAIKAIGASLNIPDPVKVKESDRNWGKMLGDKDLQVGIWAELHKRKKQADPAWTQEISAFYQDVYTDLCAIRTAWRNPVMHVEGTYAPERAQHIFNLIKGFMQHLVERVRQA